MVDVVVHEDVAGTGCGAGVAGSPWKNVEPPYTPIGYEWRPCQRSTERTEEEGLRNHLIGVPGALVEPGPVVSGHVPVAAHLVVDVITEGGRSRAIDASAETELGCGNEVLSVAAAPGYWIATTGGEGIKRGRRTVHSCSCTNCPVNALENTRPPMGLPGPIILSHAHGAVSNRRLYRSHQLRGDRVRHQHRRQGR